MKESRKAMKRKILKVIVPILVLAMLLQVPFALSASASDLADSSKYEFVISKAEDGAAGNVKVQLFATTAESAEITTFGAALVFDTEKFDIVNKSGEVVTDAYLVDSKQVGSSFPITAEPVDEGLSFNQDFMGSTTLTSYNADSGEMYLFISALSDVGLSVAPNSLLATFYLQTKGDAVPSAENMRKMELSEVRNAQACPNFAIYPGEISSTDHAFNPLDESDIITDVTLTFDYPVAPATGNVSGALTGDNQSAPITIVLANEEASYETTVSGKSAEYQFTDVAPGTYTITFTSLGSLGYTINNVVVAADETKEVPSINLLYGDCNEDGAITGQDVGILLNAYGASEAVCDVDGNGTVTGQDLGVIVLSSHFGMSADLQQITLD